MLNVVKKIANITHNAWIVSGPLSIYIRRGWRCFTPGKLTPTIEIANVTVRKPGQGIFTNFLQDIECWAATASLTVYVENVIDERFRNFFRKRGYTQTEGGFGTESFYLEHKNGQIASEP